MMTGSNHGWMARARGGMLGLTLALAGGLATPALAGDVRTDPLAPAEEAPAARPLVKGSVEDFYRARQGQPLWFGAGQSMPAQMMLELLMRANLDGLRPTDFVSRRLRGDVRAALGGDPRDVARADRALSEAFVRYVAALRGPSATRGWTINDKELKPALLTPAEYLSRAANAADLSDYVLRMGWMHSDYALMRLQLAEMVPSSAQARLVRLNMDRLRLLPGADHPGRYVIVNAASQRLAMMENGRIVDWMRVVVGKPAAPTPMMAAMIRYANLNPYWNLPDDLVAERIGPNIDKYGLPYMKEKGYEVLSDWGENPRLVDPNTDDWPAVIAGKATVRLRQKPGPANAMGRMKFMFPNPAGVYLHDTPQKDLMGEDARLFSAGCVRLSDAPRLGRWLFGRNLKASGSQPEQKVELDAAVPVYLAYMTAVPSGTSLVLYEDVYNRDRTAMADLGLSPQLAMNQPAA